jgi:L-fuculose-phosphate aldolase
MRPSTWRRDRHLIAAMRRLEADGLVVGSVGNASHRLPGALRITPTRTPYGALRPRHLITVALDGPAAPPPPPGHRAPSRETPLHLAIYRARPDVGAIVHTHSACATAWSFLGSALAPAIEDAAYYEIGPVRTAPAAPAGSQALADAAVGALGASSAVLLAGHGVLAAAADLASAFTVARAVEHHARIAWMVGLGTRLPGGTFPG